MQIPSCKEVGVATDKMLEWSVRLVCSVGYSRLQFYNKICLLGCAEREIRLVGGSNSTEGRVEICFSDEWGTVCDQMWDMIDSSVVCRQLGLATIGKWKIKFSYIILFTCKSNSLGAQALTGSSFGEGTGRIWLANVQCTGNERELSNCSASSGDVNSCTHAQDVGVRCPRGTVLLWLKSELQNHSWLRGFSQNKLTMLSVIVTLRGWVWGHDAKDHFTTRLVKFRDTKGAGRWS